MSKETQDKLVSDFKDVIADVEVYFKETAGELSEKAKVVREDLSKKLDVTKIKLDETEKVLREQAVATAKETDKVIREHPYESIGVAFGVGVLLGVILNRK
ncbi:MAG: DUF883 domain-containing protein [Verrucomicrobiota bacterium]